MYMYIVFNDYYINTLAILKYYGTIHAKEKM